MAMAVEEGSADLDKGAESKTQLSAPQKSTVVSEGEKEEDSRFERQIKWFGRFRSYESLLRPVSQTRAMSWWKRVSHVFRCGRKHDDRPSHQYRIPPQSEKQGKFAFLQMVGEEMFVSMTRFFGRANFVDLILVFVLSYFAFIFVFAFIFHGVILLYDKGGTTCVEPYDYVTYDFSSNFIRSFDLSWTTFSTVGYGTVSTAADSSCLGLRYLLALQAFNGILFVGVCGGVFFTKTSRLHTRAYVTFSSCMCLQFGQGVSEAYNLSVETSERGAHSVVQLFSRRNVIEHIKGGAEASRETPFPVLVFRVINNRAGMGGEISDASIKCMVVCRAATVDDTNLDDDDESDRVSIDGEEVNNGVDSSSSRPITAAKKTIYYKLRVSPEVNSFFSDGVWCVRHVMDDKSPLVKPSIRRQIAETASWPSDIDTYSKIRDCVTDDFQEIVVTFNGTSNLTADNVFKTVSYKQEDIFVGWQFAHMLYLKEGGKASSGLDIQVDPDLLNDIIPQKGGGNEPLGNSNDGSAD